MFVLSLLLKPLYYCTVLLKKICLEYLHQKRLPCSQWESTREKKLTGHVYMFGLFCPTKTIIILYMIRLLISCQMSKGKLSRRGYALLQVDFLLLMESATFVTFFVPNPAPFPISPFADGSKIPGECIGGQKPGKVIVVRPW